MSASRIPLRFAFSLLFTVGPLAFPAMGQVLHYTFDEAGSGTTSAVDSGSAPPANGTFLGGATHTSNSIAGSPGALDLTANGGVGNTVSGGDADKLDSMPGLTVTMWINLRGTISPTTTLASDVANVPIPAGQGGWTFGVGGTDPSNANVFIEIWDSNSGVGVFSQQKFNADHQWVMVAGTLNSSNLMQTYFGTPDSPMIAAGVLSGGRSLLPNNSPFTIGGAPFAHPTVPAWIDDVRIYDHALSLSELDAIRSSPALPEPASGGLGTLALVARRRNHRRRTSAAKGTRSSTVNLFSPGSAS